MKKWHKNQPKSITVAELARHLDCRFEGDGNIKILDVSSLEEAKKGDLVFCADPKYRDRLETTKASAAIVSIDEKFERIPTIRSEQPYVSFIKALDFFYTPYRPEPGIHPQAVVSPSAKIGKDVAIGAFVFIDEEVDIRDGSVVFPFVSVYPRVRIGEMTVCHSFVSIREDCRIGNRVILHNGVVIGSDGFGFQKAEDGSHIKIPQKGIVIIEDDVEIGANTTVDRAALGETVIKKGTKIDNLVQVAHSVEIGPDSILAAQTGIAGSSKVGKNFIAGGQVGIPDHITIGDDVIIAAKSGITKDLPSGAFVSGSPHLDIRAWRKAWAAIPQLYDLIRDIRKLRKRVEDLENKLGK
ncbi:MAG: UDP-3-O-(3-hydroxymyristoyl)glucosamine N-acyltransferase [Candidatus Aminicenantes bacterium]|jgi:UDP-3-O-[3-hydroxymyristoyl] glucosamine N-acyltransferase